VSHAREIHVSAPRAALLLVALLQGAACSREDPRASGPGERSVRVPAAVRIARSLETLSVSFDPAATATTTVVVHPGMVLGLEAETFVFPTGGTRPARGRLLVQSGDAIEGDTSTWSTAADGIPAPGRRYEVEVQVVVFETDVPPGRGWSPRAGRFEALWTRTLRQAEE
jgi:hypothetical protein